MGDEWRSLAFLDLLINNAPWCGNCKIPRVFGEAKMERGNNDDIYHVIFLCPECGDPRKGKLSISPKKVFVDWHK